MNTLPRVYNRKTDDIPNDAVYVGRPSKWGNPYSHKPDSLAECIVGSRLESIEKYIEYINEVIKDQAVLDVMIAELRGRDLVCWCTPELCHASILLNIVND